MAVAKKAVKKAVKSVSKSAPKPKTLPSPPSVWVVSERTQLFFWRPTFYATDSVTAVAYKNVIERNSSYGISAAKVDMVRGLVPFSKVG